MKCTSMSEEDTLGQSRREEKGKKEKKRKGWTMESQFNKRKRAASWRESSGNNFPVPSIRPANGSALLVLLVDKWPNGHQVLWARQV